MEVQSRSVIMAWPPLVAFAPVTSYEVIDAEPKLWHRVGCVCNETGRKRATSSFSIEYELVSLFIDLPRR